MSLGTPQIYPNSEMKNQDNKASTIKKLQIKRVLFYIHRLKKDPRNLHVSRIRKSHTGWNLVNTVIKRRYLWCVWSQFGLYTATYYRFPYSSHFWKIILAYNFFFSIQLISFSSTTIIIDSWISVPYIIIVSVGTRYKLLCNFNKSDCKPNGYLFKNK